MFTLITYAIVFGLGYWAGTKNYNPFKDDDQDNSPDVNSSAT